MKDLNVIANLTISLAIEKHPEYLPISTMKELEQLNSDEIVEGYLSAQENTQLLGSDKSKSYWHGWRNGMVDFHKIPIDDAQRQLAKEVVNSQVVYQFWL